MSGRQVAVSLDLFSQQLHRTLCFWIRLFTGAMDSLIMTATEELHGPEAVNLSMSGTYPMWVERSLRLLYSLVFQESESEVRFSFRVLPADSFQHNSTANLLISSQRLTDKLFQRQNLALKPRPVALSAKIWHWTRSKWSHFGPLKMKGAIGRQVSVFLELSDWFLNYIMFPENTSAVFTGT